MTTVWIKSTLPLWLFIIFRKVLFHTPILMHIIQSNLNLAVILNSVYVKLLAVFYWNKRPYGTFAQQVFLHPTSREPQLLRLYCRFLHLYFGFLQIQSGQLEALRSLLSNYYFLYANVRHGLLHHLLEIYRAHGEHASKCFVFLCRCELIWNCCKGYSANFPDKKS